MASYLMAPGGDESPLVSGEASNLPRPPTKPSGKTDSGPRSIAATDAHLRVYAMMLVRQGLPFISEVQWGLLLCASFFGMLRRRWYLTANLGHDDEPPIGVPPYAVAWVLRLVTLLLVFSLRGVRHASGRLGARPERARRALLAIEFLVRILAAVSLAGEVYFWALTPAYQRDAVALDVRSALDPEAPRWLVLFSTSLFLVNIAAFVYSIVAVTITALYLYVWISALVSGSRNDGVEKTMEEGRLDGSVDKARSGNLYIRIVEEGLEEKIDLLSSAA